MIRILFNFHHSDKPCLRCICFTMSTRTFPCNPFFCWKYWAFQNPLFHLAKSPIFPELNRRLIQYHILLSLPFVYLENCFFVNCNCNLVLLKLRLKEVEKALAVLSVARVLIFLSCIVKELSLSTKFWKDDDLPLHAILNALSCMRFNLLLRFRLWNIQTKW